mgnify:FL=1
MRLPWFALVLLVAAVGGGAPSARAAAKEKDLAPVVPHYDPPDQPFRMAPMPQSTRSIVVPLATNLHLAFDTALLRTHTVWSGKGLALLGPQYGLPKSPFISTNDGTVLWTMPPVFPWAVRKMPEKDAVQLPSGARFIGCDTAKESTAFLYQLQASNETVSVRELAIATRRAALLRRFEIGPCKQPLFFLAHAEDGASVQHATDFNSPPSVVLRRGQTSTAVMLLSTNHGSLASQSMTVRYEAGLVTEASAEKGVPSRAVEVSQSRVWMKVLPHAEPIQLELLTDLFAMTSQTDGVAEPQLRRVSAGAIVKGALVRPSSASTSAFRAEAFPLPKEVNLLITGMDFLPTGDLVVCTWTGEVWIIEGAQGAPAAAKYRRFARGLCEPMGVAVRDGKIYVGTKQGLYRLNASDKHRPEADLFECLNQDWDYTGSYNAFSYGPVFDKAGNFILANAGHSGRWDARYKIGRAHV